MCFSLPFFLSLVYTKVAEGEVSSLMGCDMQYFRSITKLIKIPKAKKTL